MVPFFFTITSHIFITFSLSFFIFIGINIIGIFKHNFKILSIFFPTGAPILIAPFLIIIEIILYFSRTFSLAIRLFVNMMAGHTLLKILSIFT
jgi:F-type H+-transporting ATPase subunit a